MTDATRTQLSRIGCGIGVASALLVARPALGAEGRGLVDISQYLPRWAEMQVLGIELWRLAAAFAFVLAGLVLEKVADYVIRKKCLPLTEKTSFRLDNLLVTAVSKPFAYLLLFGGFAGAVAVLPLPEGSAVRFIAWGAVKVFLIANFIWFLFRIVDVLVLYLASLAERTESKLDDQLVPLVRKALKITIAIVSFVWVVQLMGYSVSSLIAGLGIGGLAVALALQDSLGNFFGSVFIFLDRPFAPGDWIKVAGVEGTVEEVGFRSTRIRTWPHSLVSVPNKTVASSTIDNWSRMPNRRVYQTIGVTYDTTPEQMEAALAKIKRIVEGEEDVDKKFYVIRFTDFGESSLNVMLYYFTKSVGWDAHLATKEGINLAIMKALKGLGLSIAFPTRTVHLAGTPEASLPPGTAGTLGAQAG